MSDIAENDTGSVTDSDSVQAISTKKKIKTTLMRITDIAIFGVILHQALMDPETTDLKF